MTGPDAVDLFNGRISREQFVKNLAVVVAGVAGGYAGVVAGSAAGSAVPIVGNAAGAVLGGLVCGLAALTVAEVASNALFQSDSEKMYEILQNEFAACCVDYSASQEEADSLATKLKESLDGNRLKDMFASEDREEFARELIEPMFEDLSGSRTFADLPSDYEVRTQTLDQLDGVVFIH